jgi:coenzyme F420-0:L-glutamate ligase / coenzyme F420-1:gamma-L-glutamate ligase
MISILPVEGVPEVRPGDDLAALIATACNARPDTGLVDDDVVVIAHKAVSKAEGRFVDGDDRLAAALSESTRVLRRVGDMVISETRHGFVCANSGVDASNVEGNRLVLLPIDPDLSARRLRARLEHLTGTRLGVIVSDTFGRAWRMGQTNVAIGVAGVAPFVDYRGTLDAEGRELTATEICVADEIAGAAELVMGKTLRVCAAVVRGTPVRFERGSARQIVRPPDEDLFR